ncbi:hypothetical protein [Zooshikella sp. RANM57]|uniref:hypothetical protein n=1 Tax=Zooshikella sp. RANM57 TaxID=3425863 RepID=UPI003D6DF07D
MDENKDFEDWGETESGDERNLPLRPLPEPLENDRHVYRTAVYALTGGILISLLGGIWLASNDKDIPQMLVAVASACAGALGALIAPNRG